MVKVDSFSFGTIVINGEKYHHDVLLCPDGTGRKRKGGIWRFGSRSFKKEEIEELKGAEAVVIGLGTNNKARVSNAVKDYASESNLMLLTLPISEVVKKLGEFLEQRRRAAAILHITC